MKYTKKIVASVLTASLVLTSFPVSAFAAEINTEKEEVVYINLNADGSLQETNVVNIFELETDGKIVDYGTYEEVQNLTTTDEIDYTNDTITIDTSAGKLYYQGKMSDHEIPWDISVKYYMDGTEYSAKEIAGKSGALKITVSIEENKAAAEDFFDHYALQASITLDTEKCKNIVSENATIANVGSNKQLTYTILPGKGADITITADVTEFETDGFAINGIPLNLSIDVDDEELMDQITELLEAIELIDDGTTELKDGTKTLQDSIEKDLQTGVEALDEGADQLHDGSGALVNGGTAVTDGAEELADGTAALDSGITELNAGIAQIQAGLDALNEKSGKLTDGSAQMKDALEQLQTALSSVSASAEQIQALVQASSQIKTGIDALVTGVKALEDGVNYQTYKALMQENGLDIDELVAGNNSAINSINELLSMVTTVEETLEKFHIPPSLIAPMKEKCVTLANQLLLLLQGNNGAIYGMEQYLNEVSANIGTLADGAASLQENYKTFDAAIAVLASSLVDMLKDMTTLKESVDLLVTEYGKLDEGLNVYTDGVTQVVVGYEQMAVGAKTLAVGSSALSSGSSDLYKGTQELLTGIQEIYAATGTLSNGTGTLDDGVAELLTGVIALYDGTSELNEGTGELRSETAGMDTEISDQIDELLSMISGGDSETVSFVSDKNTNVKAVQFVIQTEGIHAEKAEEVVAEPEENLSFWQKLLALFGL